MSGRSRKRPGRCGIGRGLSMGSFRGRHQDAGRDRRPEQAPVCGVWCVGLGAPELGFNPSLLRSTLCLGKGTHLPLVICI